MRHQLTQESVWLDGQETWLDFFSIGDSFHRRIQIDFFTAQKNLRAKKASMILRTIQTFLMVSFHLWQGIKWALHTLYSDIKIMGVAYCEVTLIFHFTDAVDKHERNPVMGMCLVHLRLDSLNVKFRSTRSRDVHLERHNSSVKVQVVYCTLL